MAFAVSVKTPGGGTTLTRGRWRNRLVTPSAQTGARLDVTALPAQPVLVLTALVRRRRAFIPLCVLLLLAAGACQGDPSGPADSYELPDPDLRLDPDLLTVGDTLVSCGTWKAARPAAGTRLLVDVHFGGAGVSEHGAHDSHARGVEAVGGKVLIGFPFPALRVRINAERVDDLLANWPRTSVFSVPNAARYDWGGLRVQYARQFTEPDSLRIVSLGGRVRSVTLVDNVQAHALVDLPAISITPLRAEAGVSWVAPNGTGSGACL